MIGVLTSPNFSKTVASIGIDQISYHLTMNVRGDDTVSN